MDTMEYKGYRGTVRYSADDRVLHGRIFGIDDVVTFEGADVDELEKAFHEAVEDYLALCEKIGRAPEREYSGKIPLRIEADLHRRVAIAADSEKKSVNGWIADTIAAAAVKTVKGGKSASGSMKTVTPTSQKRGRGAVRKAARLRKGVVRARSRK